MVAAAAHIILLLGSSPAPTVFDDELGYQRLAQSLGDAGQLALFGRHGLTYSPLYPLLLSPFYALHLSGPAAYRSALIVNCILLAIAGVPIYRIARFVLTPARSLAVVALSSLAPLMLFSSFVMSENLAYPLFLFAVWAMLVTVRTPGARADAVVLGLCVLCTATRLEFVALIPAALAAVLLAAIVEGASSGIRPRRRLRRALRDHRLLVAANALLVAGAVAIIAGSSLLALAGRYANQRNIPVPSPWRIADLVAQHVAGLDLGIGVIPFVGTLVAAVLWFRRRGRAETDAFAAVAVSSTAVVIVTTAFAAYGQSFPHGADLPRIHERYYFYLFPLFLIGLVATLGIPRSAALLRVGVAVAAVGALLPTAIPFSSVINRTAGIDSFGLLIFATSGPRGVEAVRHTTLIAVFLASCLGLAYALARPKAAVVVAVAVVVFVWMSSLERAAQVNAARLAMDTAFAGRRDWVDAAARDPRVPLVENPRRVGNGLGVAETAFFNLSVARLYYPCRPVLSGDFGEEQVELGPGGQLLVGGAPVRSRYAVVPADHGVEGRVVAADARARLVLVETTDGILRVTPARRDRWACPS